MTYKSFPLGPVPREKQRTELGILSEKYAFNDPREVVDIFEDKVAVFSGSKYAIAVDSCSHGIFLSLKYLDKIGEWFRSDIIIPRHTYISVPMQIIIAGGRPVYDDIEWSGVYQLGDTRVLDGAVRWTEGMYMGNNSLQVVSFQYKKRIPIGKGGMILTDDKRAYDMLRLMRYDGRDLSQPYDSHNHVRCLGYHMYMLPEDAARGIMLMDETPMINDDSGGNSNYPNVEKMMRYE